MGFVVGEQRHAPKLRIANIVVLPLLAVFVVVVLVFRVIFQVVTIEGRSMEPTLYAWDYLLATRGYATPRRGDIVSISSSRSGGIPFVKRVIAVPGDTIEIDGEQALVNGAPEPWLIPRQASEDRMGPYTVPPGAVWVMGDNRHDSSDSRYFGFVPVSAVRGRAVLVYWPPLRARRLDAARGSL